MTTYTIRAWCTNCHDSHDLDVPKGELVDDALDNIECPNCGNTTLVPQ